jgi:UDP-N-acetylglucosamine 4,6-dehydratase
MDLKNKNILITGGTGSWGQELAKQILSKYNVNSIVIYSRNENSQVMMKRKFNNEKMKFVLGDIRNLNSLRKATKNIDIIFHLAALKHVPVGEESPDEFIATNVIGTQNIRDVAIENNVKKVVLISTDKACSPINLYGYTKSLAEKIIIQANQICENTKFVCIRGGNALGSNGSVVPFFIQQVKERNELTITDNEMTRFFLTLEQAVSLIFSAVNNSFGGEIFVMKMPSFKIIDLVYLIKERYGDNNTKITTIGIKPGEKLHEVLISEHESKNAYYFNQDYIFILPQIKIENIKNIDLNIYKKFEESSFSSQIVLDKEKLKQFLKAGGFL